MASRRRSSASRRRRSASTLSWSGGDGGDPAADAIFVAQSQREERESERGLGLISNLLIFHFLKLENLHARVERERESRERAMGLKKEEVMS